jgi:bla regulator protein blaR1
MQLLFITRWFNNDALKAMAWTFVHSLWQGLVAALLAAIIISVTKRTTAKLRYNLLGTVLILFLVTAFITFFIELQQQHHIASVLQETEAIAGYNANDTIVAAVLSEGLIADLRHWFNNNIGLILLAWFIFFLFNCLKLFTGLASVNRMRNYKTHPVTEEWKIKFEKLQNSLGIRQSVQLLQSELVKVPVALGYFKPVILLPLGLMANIPAEQVETILLHELGHVRRKDYLLNFFQHFAEAIFFFNPGMRWISSLLRQEREACCDDIVVANSDQRRNYLDALVAFQEFSFTPGSYAMAISSKPNYLLNRVKRMLTKENKKLTIFEKAGLLSGMILFSAFAYTSQQKDIKAMALTIAVQQLPNRLQLTGRTEEKASITTVSPIMKKKITSLQKPVTDTIPVKKDTITQLAPENKTLPTKKDWEKASNDADKALQEIIKLKEQIGAKKETIGRKKEQLQKQEGKDKDRVMEEIEKVQGEIKGKRGELENKRALYEKLKAKEKEQEQEKKSKEWELKGGDKSKEWEIKQEKKSEVKLNFNVVEKHEVNYAKKQAPVLKGNTLFSKPDTKESLFKKKPEERTKEPRLKEPRIGHHRTKPTAPPAPVAPPMKSMPDVKAVN